MYESDPKDVAFVGKHTGDYVTLFCACGSGNMTMRYLGLDPSMPRFETSCADCRKTAEFKISDRVMKGLPMDPTPGAETIG